MTPTFCTDPEELLTGLFVFETVFAWAGVTHPRVSNRAKYLFLTD